MATLEWSAALAQGLEPMDTTHREFVELLAATQAADDSQVLAHWQTLLAHTVEHFAQEDRWMQATGFAPDNCHSNQHQVVLDIMREGARKAQAGDLAMLRGLLPELADWFSYHAQTMDAALAQHMHSVGLDVASGQLRSPGALPAAPISGCGGACSSEPAVAA